MQFSANKFVHIEYMSRVLRNSNFNWGEINCFIALYINVKSCNVNILHYSDANKKSRRKYSWKIVFINRFTVDNLII